MIDYQKANHTLNASENDTVIEFRFDPNVTNLSFDANGNIVQTNIISNHKRILQLVMKYILSNNINKYAKKLLMENLLTLIL